MRVWILEEAGMELAQGSEKRGLLCVHVWRERAAGGLGVQNQILWACGWQWTRRPRQTCKESAENEKSPIQDPGEHKCGRATKPHTDAKVVEDLRLNRKGVIKNDYVTEGPVHQEWK